MDPLQSPQLRQALIRKKSGEPLPAHTPAQVLDQQIQNAIESKLPGCTIPFNQLIADDPIECDPLIAQGNLTILRMDELFRDTYEVWLKSIQNPEEITEKRVTTCGAKTPDAQRQRKTELTTKQTQPDADMVGKALDILLAAFRVQATITHRRDCLKNPDLASAALARSLARRASEGQPAQSNKKTTSSNPDAPIRPLQPLRVISNHPQYTGFYEKGEKEWPFFIPPGMDDEDDENLDNENLDNENTGNKDTGNKDTGEYEIEDAYKVPEGVYYEDELEEQIPYNDASNPPDCQLPTPNCPSDSEDEGSTEPELPTYPVPAEFPLYTRPPFPNEKTHYYPPFAPASPEDAEEIDAYLSSLPPEVTKEKKNIAILMNEYLVPPVWRGTETELEHVVKHRKRKRQQEREKQKRRTYHKRE